MCIYDIWICVLIKPCKNDRVDRYAFVHSWHMRHFFVYNIWLVKYVCGICVLQKETIE